MKTTRTMRRIGATAVIMAAVGTVQAQYAFVPTTGTQDWNVAANWSPSTIPDGIGATVSFAPGSSPVLNVTAGTPPATYTFGNLTVTTNNTLVIGSGTGTGNFIIHGGSVPAVWTSNRTIISRAVGDTKFMLASDLEVWAGTGYDFQIDGSSGSTYAMDGGNRTITMRRGRLVLGGSGYNQNVLTNATVDLRPITGQVLGWSGSVTLLTSNSVVFQIGNNSTEVSAGSGSPGFFANRWDLFGDVKFALAPGSTTRTLTIAGLIQDVSGTNRLTFDNTTTTNNRSAIVHLNATNTYGGGTIISATGPVGGGFTSSTMTVNANTVGALGGGNVTIGPLATLNLNQPAIADTATVYLSSAIIGGSPFYGRINIASTVNNTISGLYLDGVPQPVGTYGSFSSNATYKSDDWFAGTGILTVIPEPGTIGIVILGAGVFFFRRRRGSPPRPAESAGNP